MKNICTFEGKYIVNISTVIDNRCGIVFRLIVGCCLDASIYG